MMFDVTAIAETDTSVPEGLRLLASVKSAVFLAIRRLSFIILRRYLGLCCYLVFSACTSCLFYR
jgi:hypothetical protein